MTIQQKADFLQNDYIAQLRALPEDTAPKWGKMNVRQMIEHMSDYVRIANGKTSANIVTEEERLPRMQSFLMSDKPFPENTPNVLMPDMPPAVKNPSKNAAVDELKSELAHFADVYNADSAKTLANPFFGVLDYEQQVQLLHKHATHHLRQFGIE